MTSRLQTLRSSQLCCGTCRNIILICDRLAKSRARPNEMPNKCTNVLCYAHAYFAYANSYSYYTDMYLVHIQPNQRFSLQNEIFYGRCWLLLPTSRCCCLCHIFMYYLKIHSNTRKQLYVLNSRYMQNIQIYTTFIIQLMHARTQTSTRSETTRHKHHYIGNEMSVCIQSVFSLLSSCFLFILSIVPICIASK